MRYDWVTEPISDPCDLCNLTNIAGAVVDTTDTDIDYPEGLHIQHTCELCGMLLLDQLG